MKEKKEKPKIDFSNLQKEFDNLRYKFWRLQEFKLVLLGIVFGAVISAAIQILLIPFSYEKDTVRYDETIILTNIGTIGYFLIVLCAAGLLLFVLYHHIYKPKILGIKSMHTVSIKYTGDSDELYKQFRETLHKECTFCDLICKADDEKTIRCYRRYTTTPGEFDEENVLDFVFDESLSIIKITFLPEDAQSMRLLNILKKKYEECDSQ